MRQNIKNVSPMSNEGRNQYVVEHITDAVLKLMQSNNFNDISISQICEKAGVGRASFYRNFSKQGLAHLSLQSIKEACGPKPDQPNVVAYTTAYFSYGLYGWIEEWFKRGMQETPKECEKKLRKTANRRKPRLQLR